MSAGFFCNRLIRNKANWRVVQRNCNHSAFNGYRQTPSAYSAVKCLICCRTWRTKAAYVASLADYRGPDVPEPIEVTIPIQRI